MKNIFLLVFILLICLLILCFIPVTKKITIPVHTNVFNITSSIVQPVNWKKWQPSVKTVYDKNPALVNINKDSGKNAFYISVPQHKFTVTQISPVLYSVQETVNSTAYDYTMNIIPVKGNEVNLLLAKKVNVLHLLFPFKESPADITANSLKYFLETPDAFYGYPIRTEKIMTDTVVATQKMRIPEKYLFQVLPQCFSEMEQYMQQNGLQAVNNWEVSYNDLYNDSIEVMAGIPVNRPAPSSGKIQCLHIPIGAGMLVSSYEGRFKDRNNIYSALDRYMADHHLLKAAVPFERYADNILPTSDTSMVKFEIYYPVY